MRATNLLTDPLMLMATLQVQDQDVHSWSWLPAPSLLLRAQGERAAGFPKQARKPCITHAILPVQQ